MNSWGRCLTIIGIWMLCTVCVPTAGTAAENIDDGDITFAVETELIVDQGVPHHRIDVSTVGGVVTLSGSVDSYYAKLAAADAAEGVRGVASVINEIEVRPLSRSDTEITEDIESALRLDPVTETREITVDVQQGVVTLTGKVDSHSEKDVAQELTENVKGVTDVRNKLTYRVVPDRTDADIKADIQYRLRSDASIGAGLISVDVKDGKVTLSGSVGSAKEKREAESETWAVPGVKSVVNEILADYWLGSDTKDWGDAWHDVDMEQSIEKALLTDPRVMAFNVTATVNDGVATLTGIVENLLAKRTAEEETKDVLGIWRVNNRLRVRPRVSATDAEIADSIRDALQRNPFVDRFEIAVSVHNGLAHLGGIVDSWFILNQAEEAAASVQGVVATTNNLDVRDPIVTKPDWEIKDDIESHLWWSPFVDGNDITVDVTAGVATLTGSVEDWSELQAAKDNAEQGGASAVICNLDMVYGNGSTGGATED